MPIDAKSPLHPDVKVKLVGTNGNAYALMGECCAAAKRAGLHADTIKAFTAEAVAGDYGHLLRTCAKWFKVS